MSEEIRINLPVSKSLAIRKLMLDAYLGNIHSEIDTTSSTDIQVLQNALIQNGNEIDFQDAGTPLRLFLSYAALKSCNSIITGSERLKQRPIKPLLLALESLGAKFEYLESEYCLPLKLVQVVNPQSNRVEIDAGNSSQFVSSLMLLAAFMDKGLEILVLGDKVSEPYISLTENMLLGLGVQIDKRENILRISGKVISHSVYKSEPDWSAAAFFFAACSVKPNLKLLLKDLSLNSAQGDREMAHLFSAFGVVSFENQDRLLIVNNGKINLPEYFDIRNYPDSFPALISTISFLKLEVKIKGVKNLRMKESDRVDAMKQNLVGRSEITYINEDELWVRPTEVYTPKYKFNAFDDHRIAMACALFSFENQVEIQGKESVSKSFPYFWDEWVKLTDDE